MPANVIIADTAKEFQDALQQLEAANDAEDLLRLFAPNASLQTPAMAHPLTGSESIRNFWRHYRSAFQSVRTDFRLLLRDGDDICLEWTACAVPYGDHAPIHYAGVTLLRVAGGKIQEMRTYFDTHPFVTLPSGPPSR